MTKFQCTFAPHFIRRTCGFRAASSDVNTRCVGAKMGQLSDNLTEIIIVPVCVFFHHHRPIFVNTEKNIFPRHIKEKFFWCSPILLFTPCTKRAFCRALAIERVKDLSVCCYVWIVAKITSFREAAAKKLKTNSAQVRLTSIKCIAGPLDTFWRD